MYDRILFPTDGSESAESTLPYALDIAVEHDATLHVLNVADTDRESLASIRGQVVDALEEEGRRIVEGTAARAADRCVSVVTEVRQGDPSTTIVEYGTQVGVDLLVMPTHGRRGIERILLGSVTERVINTASAPVISVDPDGDVEPLYPCERVLVPTDGSRGAELALSEGIAVATATGATLHVLHVIETGSLGIDARSVVRDEEVTDRANEIVTAAVETARAAGLDAIESEIEHGVPSKAIRTYIEANGIDLAVLGTHGATDFSRYVMGGVSAKLVRTSPIPLLWVREPESNGANGG